MWLSGIRDRAALLMGILAVLVPLLHSLIPEVASMLPEAGEVVQLQLPEPVDLALPTPIGTHPVGGAFVLRVHSPTLLPQRATLAIWLTAAHLAPTKVL